MSLSELYQHYIIEKADPRINNWFLVENPLHIGLIIFSYAYFVLKCGPKFMEKRKPYSLKSFMFIYNIFQIISNAYIVKEIYSSGWSTEYSLGCEPVRRTLRPIDRRMLSVVHWVLMMKTIDLVETMVFVLRKKDNQVSFLHLYHHISTVFVTYYCVKYEPGGMVSLQMIINGSIHVMMYTYYLLASLGPEWQKIINPFKPYITSLQLVQFVILVIHQSQMFSSSCPVSKLTPTIIVGNLLLNFCFFLNFYRQNYTKRIKKVE